MSAAEFFTSQDLFKTRERIADLEKALALAERQRDRNAEGWQREGDQSEGLRRELKEARVEIVRLTAKVEDERLMRDTISRDLDIARAELAIHQERAERGSER